MHVHYKYIYMISKISRTFPQILGINSLTILKSICFQYDPNYNYYYYYKIIII